MSKILFLRLFSIAFVTLFAGAAIADEQCETAECAFVENVRKTAEQGDADTQYKLGLVYYSGIGIARDYREAVRWFRLAAEQGHVDAQYNLGQSYRKGEGVVKDYGEAGRWYLLAAEQGDVVAQYSLGVMYSKGHGVVEDKHEAVRWFRLAAEQGYADAQYNLGQSYSTGKGVAKDYHEAGRWYKLAAKQGYAAAQFNLGLMYENGWGLDKNKSEAAYWYSKAAAQGIAEAQHNLDVINKFEINLIVKIGIVLAIFLFIIRRVFRKNNKGSKMPKHPWTEEDNIIALDAYFSTVDERKMSKDSTIARAVSLVNRRSLRDNGRGFGADKFGSMEMKIRCFENVMGDGELEHISETGQQVWAQYNNAPDKLAKRMAEIIATLPKE